jgi:hypothetical protein
MVLPTLLSLCLLATPPLDPAPGAVEGRLLKDVEYLASDELEGRGVRTRGIDLAADFLADEFRRIGLKTDHYQGTPFHEFTVYTGGSHGTVQTLTWHHGDEHVSLTTRIDYTSLMVTSSGNFRLPLAFVGYGITAPDLGYDDYAGLDVRGHAVVMLRQEPRLADPESPFGGAEPTEHAYLLTKIRNAVKHGAAAVVVGTDRASLPPALDGAATHAETLLDVELTSGLGGDSLPVVHVRRPILDGWLRTAGLNLGEIEASIDRTLHPTSQRLAGAELEGRVALTRPGRKLRNVVATLEGHGEHAAETIIVGAHYDHLGRGGWGSLAIGANGEIHNGADDNASGTAVLLETARQLTARSTPLPRRVLFLAFTGEELGLYGSKRYVQDPLIPLTDTVAMLNLDMVGRLRQDRLIAYGVGTAEEWPGWLKDSAAVPKLQILGEPSGFGPSDHAPFHERGVPVIHFFTGFHPEYHRPPDDVPLINIPGMRRVTELLVELVIKVAEAPKRPTTTTVDQPFRFADDGSLSGLFADEAPLPRRQLGVRLKPRGTEPGLEIERILSGSHAERIGLRAGDILLRFNEAPLNDVAGLATHLEALTAGARFRLTFDRGGVQREIETGF